MYPRRVSGPRPYPKGLAHLSVGSFTSATGPFARRSQAHTVPISGCGGSLHISNKLHPVAEPNPLLGDPMTLTPLADGLRRRTAYRRISVVVGAVGVVLSIYGISTGAPLAIIIGLVLFVVVGFAFHIAGNSTLNTAIDAAAYGFLGRPVPATVPLAIRGMHIEVFQQAVVRHHRTGQTLDDAFRSELAALVASGRRTPGR